MKTVKQSIVFHGKDVVQFVQAVGDRNPIYTSVEEAQKRGFKTIPLPPTMPVIAYQRINIPWTLEAPVIHRKQQSTYHEVMYIDQNYECQITLTAQSRRKNYQFFQQTLCIYDSNETLCFTGISHILAGGVQ